MLGNDDVHAPRPATLTDAPERVTEFAFALSDPDRTALLAALVATERPETAEDLAGAAQLDADAAREHLKVLVAVGLAATKRTGLTRKRTYVPTVTDLEVRFFAGQTLSRSGRTQRALERDAKRRERQKRKLARKEKRIAKEARRS